MGPLPKTLARTVIMMARLLTLVVLVTALAGCGEDSVPTQVEQIEGTGALTWSWLNRLPQGNNLIDVAASDERAFAVGAGGVVLVNQTGSSTWSFATSPSPGADLNGAAFMENGVMLATGDDGTFASEDAGATWTRVDNTPGMRAIAVRGTRGIAVGRGVAFTEDGESWSVPTFSPVSRFRDVAFLDDAVAIAIESARIHKTTDGGRTWSEIAQGAGMSNLTRVAFINGEIGVAVSQSPSRIFYTGDGGATWAAMQDFDGLIKDVEFLGEDLGVLFTHTRQSFLSFDTGKSWERVSRNPEAHQIINSLAIVDSRTYVGVGSAGLLMRTENRASSWQDESSGHHHRFIDVAFPTRDVGVAIAHNNTVPKLLRTIDGGFTWTESAAPLVEPQCVEFLDANLGIMLDRGGIVLKSVDAGATWTTTGAGPTDHELLACTIIDDQTWVICGDDSAIHRTTDGGRNWQLEAFSPALGRVYRDVDFFPGTTTGVAVGFGAAVRSEDAGDTWDELGFDSPFQSFAVACVDADVAIAVGDVIRRSADRGRSWQVVYSDNVEAFTQVAFGDENHGVAVGGNGILAETLDGGRTWTEIRAADKDLFGVTFRDRDSAVATGIAGTLLLGLDL